MTYLDKSIISWQLRKATETEYEDNNNYFAGTYSQDSSLKIQFLVWNNRGGKEPVEDMSSFSISVSFENLEDSALLNYLSGKIEDNVISPVVNGAVATFTPPASCKISGKINNGNIDDSYDNYIFFELSLDVPKTYQLKPNDLKTMSLDIVKL